MTKIVSKDSNLKFFAYIIFSIQSQNSSISNRFSFLKHNISKIFKNNINLNIFVKSKNSLLKDVIKIWNTNSKNQHYQDTHTWTVGSTTSWDIDSTPKALSSTVLGRMTYPNSFPGPFTGRWAEAPICPSCQVPVNFNAGGTCYSTYHILHALI